MQASYANFLIATLRPLVLSRTVLSGLALLFFATSASAQIYWDSGGNNRWNTSSSWNTDTVPGINDDVVFDNTYQATLDSTIQLRGTRSAASVTFDTGDTIAIVNGNGNRTLNLRDGEITSLGGGSHSFTNNRILLQSDGIFHVAESSTLSISASIRDSSGTRGLTKTGDALLVLSGANTYSGTTTVSAGTLRYGANNTIASGAVTVNGGTLDLATYSDTVGAVTLSSGTITSTSGTLSGSSYVFTNSGTVSGQLGGFGTLTKTGTGTVTMSGANTYSGITTISNGTILATNASALGSSTWSNVINGGTLALSGGISMTEGSFNISGTGYNNQGAIQNVSGSNTLSATLSFTGDATIRSDADSLTLSTLSNGSGYTSDLLGDGDITVTGSYWSGGDMNLGGAGDRSFNGAMSLNSGKVLTIDSTGTNTVTGALTADGGIDINAGTTVFSSTVTSTGNMDVGASAGAVTVGSTTNLGAGSLTINNAATNTFTGNLTANGGIDLNGGINNFAANVTASGGMDIGAAAGATSVTGYTALSGGTLAINNSATNSFTGAVTANGGVDINGGTNSFGNTITASGGMDIGASAGATNVTGTTNLSSGTLSINNSATNNFAAVTANGGITINAGTNNFSGTVASSAGLDLAAGADDTSFTGTVNLSTGTLNIANAGANTFGGNLTAGTMNLDGSGTTTLSGSGSNSIATTNFNSGTLVLNKTPGINALSGTVVVGNDIDAATLQLAQSNQIADGTTINLSSTGSFDLDGNDERIGDLILNGSAVDSGAGTLTLDTITSNASAASSTVAGNLALNSYDSTVTVADGAAAEDLAISANISGSNKRLNKAGDGTLVLSGTSTFEGNGGTWDAGVKVLGGTVAISADANLGSTNNNVSLADGTTLEMDGSFSAHANRRLKLAGTSTVDVTDANTAEWAGIVESSGALQKAGTGTLVLSGTNTYSGGTTINTGTLQIGNGGTTGSVTGNITNNAALAFNRSDSVTYSGVVSGSGSLTQAGSGTLILTGTNTHSGDTTVSTGTLQLGNGGTTGSVTGNITNDAALVFNRSDSVTYNGEISGTGSLSQSGSGTLILDGANTHSGGTTVASGTLQIGNGGTTGSLTGNITNNSALIFDRSDATNPTSIIAGSGTVTQTGTGSLTLSSANTYTGSTTVDSGSTLIAAHANALGTTAGGTTVATGAELQLTNNIAVGAEALTLTGTGNLDNTSGTNSYGGVISGAGTVTTTSGTLTLSAANTFSGDITIGSGSVLVATNDDALGSGGGSTTVQSGGTLEVNGGVDIDTETNISLAGVGVTTDGALLSTGGTNIVDTPMSLAANATIGATSGTLQLGTQGNDPELNLSGFDLTLNTNGGDITVESDFTGTGDIYKTGSGTLTLNHGEAYPAILSPDTDFFLNDGTTILNTYATENSGMRGDITIGDGLGSVGTAILQQGLYESGTDNSNEIISNTSNITINSDGYWDLQGHKEVVNHVTMNGGTIDAKKNIGDANRLDIGGTLHATADATINGLLGLNNQSAASLIVDSGATLDLNATLSNAGFDKTGDGTLILSGGNTYVGNTEISDGIVIVDNNSGLGSVGSSYTRVDSGAQLQLAAVNIGAEPLKLSGTGHNADGTGALRATTGTNTVGGAVALEAHAEIQTDLGATLIVNGNITGSGKTLTVDSLGTTTFNGNNTFNTLEKNGAGLLTVTGTNTYATANVNAGTFALGNTNILADAMDVNLGASGTFAVGTYTETIDDLNGSGTLTIAAGGVLGIDKIGNAGAFTGDLDIDGIMTLNGGLIGPGADGSLSTGTMMLNASSTLEIAADFVFGGTLELAANTVLNLTGNGTTFDLGTLHITGDTVIDFSGVDTATFNIGSLIIDPGVAVSATGWESFNDLWTAANFSGATLDERNSTTAQITFNGFTPADTIWLTYDYGANEITVPEPSSYGALLMAAALASHLLRRRHQQVGRARRARQHHATP
ncbi:autotransporter-associated beta strand repeat-containing protein [Synoicihabitans lomoniglobus]|uniref:Autotransporter-associated beta strand repeat-containing protein n=3 Tax=Synoicihabitans lomoniglobus TaxID=2909285 RepID=A0AAF0CRW5_9BACT|nr:autotransporter-associated beta strand repeat-containing protein [Opitutaceae bacterium LMO-M01]